MTDQPRDLAADVASISDYWRLTLQEWRKDPSHPKHPGVCPQIDALLAHIAAQSRELELQREALGWCADFGLIVQSAGGFFVTAGNGRASPPERLRETLAKALEGK